MAGSSQPNAVDVLLLDALPHSDIPHMMHATRFWGRSLVLPGSDSAMAYLLSMLVFTASEHY